MTATDRVNTPAAACLSCSDSEGAARKSTEPRTMTTSIAVMTVSIETQSDFEDIVRDTGVVVDGDLLRTEGEGRGTRYFHGDQQVSKDEAMEHFDGAGEYDVPAEDADGGEPGEGEIECLACGAHVGYLTGSHMQSHPEGLPQSAAAYREHVAAELDMEPEDVPLAPESLEERFEEWGSDHSDWTAEDFREHTEAQWDSGTYDHLAEPDEDEE